MDEQPPLALDSTGETGKRSVTPQNPVARKDNRNRISPDGRPDGPHPFGRTDAFRDLRVGRRGAFRNAEEFLPDAKLKVRSLLQLDFGQGFPQASLKVVG